MWDEEDFHEREEFCKRKEEEKVRGSVKES